MLKRQSRFYISILALGDLVGALFSWIMAYYFRFYVDIIPVTKGIPEFRIYLLLAPLVIIIWGAVFKAFGLYETGRLRSFWAEVFALLKGSTLALLLLIVISFFIQEYKFSRVVFLYFFDQRFPMGDSRMGQPYQEKGAKPEESPDCRRRKACAASFKNYKTPSPIGDSSKGFSKP